MQCSVGKKLADQSPTFNLQKGIWVLVPCEWEGWVKADLHVESILFLKRAFPHEWLMLCRRHSHSLMIILPKKYDFSFEMNFKRSGKLQPRSLIISLKINYRSTNSDICCKHGTLIWKQHTSFNCWAGMVDSSFCSHLKDYVSSHS